MKAVIYTRVSTASQTEGTSLESQEAACRSLAPDADVIQEVYSGAYLFDRPGLSKIRDKMKAGEYNRVICYAIDRLSRSIGHLSIIIDECLRYNVSLEFVTDTLDNTPEGKLLQSVKAYAAEIEREKIRERSMRGRRANAVAGTLSYKRKLFGYDIAEDKRVINPREAKIVRRLFSSIISGYSLRRLCVELNTEGIRTPHGSKTWWPHSIKSLLDNPAYCGRTTLFRYKHEIFYVAGKKKHNGSKLHDVQNHLVILELTPALISVEEWEAAQLALKQNTKKRGRQGQKDFLLRGLVRCANCGRQFSPVGKRKWRYYVCTSTQNPSINCKTKSFPAGKHEQEIWDRVCAIIKGKKPRKRKVYDPTPALTKQQERLQVEIARLVRRAGNVDDATWNIFESEIAAKREEIERLEQEKASFKRPAVSLDELRREYFHKLDLLTFEKKVELLRRLDLQLIWDGKELLTVKS